jgi:hypothetical protein
MICRERGSEMAKSQQEMCEKRMEDIVRRFQKYVATYTDQEEYTSYFDETFVDDMLYGIGLALHPIKYKWASGYDRWKAELRRYLRGDKRLSE